MENVCRYWVREFGIDGFRTDVVDRMPIEFWNRLKPRLDAIKPVMLLAEGHNANLFPSHNVSYDWYLPPAFWSIVKGKRTVARIDSVLVSERAKYPTGFMRMRHATNHDVQRMGYAWPSWASYPDQVFDKSFYDDVPLNKKFEGGIKPFMVLAATLPNSVPMLWNGQELGYLQHTPSPIMLDGYDEALYRFYEKLLNIYKDSMVFTEGDFNRIESKQSGLYIFTRSTTQEKFLVIVNCSEKEKTLTLTSGEIWGKAKELFSKNEYNLTQGGSLEVAPWDYMIFKYQ